MSAKRLFVVGSSVAFALACATILLCNWSALGFRSLSVPTGSMRPNITPGSLVLVKRVPVTSLQVGDVITYINPSHQSQTITHRITNKYLISGRVQGFVTKGDANKYTDDPPVAGGSVVGKVVWHAPYLGSAMRWSKTWFGIALLVYVPAMLLMWEEVQRMTKYLRAKLPYKLYGYDFHEKPRESHTKYVAGGIAGAVVLLVGLAFAPSTFALLRTNTVRLGPNVLTSAASSHTTCTNNTNIQVNNSSNQSASSGSASTTGNTTGGSATSGSASNSNSTNVNISVSGC